MDASTMRLEQHERGIHVVRPGTHDAGVTKRFRVRASANATAAANATASADTTASADATHAAMSTGNSIRRAIAAACETYS
jgi:hypothetical protein